MTRSSPEGEKHVLSSVVIPPGPEVETTDRAAVVGDGIPLGETVPKLTGPEPAMVNGVSNQQLDCDPAGSIS